MTEYPLLIRAMGRKAKNTSPLPFPVKLVDAEDMFRYAAAEGADGAYRWVEIALDYLGSFQHAKFQNESEDILSNIERVLERYADVLTEEDRIGLLDKLFRTLDKPSYPLLFEDGFLSALKRTTERLLGGNSNSVETIRAEVNAMERAIDILDPGLLDVFDAALMRATNSSSSYAGSAKKILCERAESALEQFETDFSKAPPDAAERLLRRVLPAETVPENKRDLYKAALRGAFTMYCLEKGILLASSYYTPNASQERLKKIAESAVRVAGELSWYGKKIPDIRTLCFAERDNFSDSKAKERAEYVRRAKCCQYETFLIGGYEEFTDALEREGLFFDETELAVSVLKGRKKNAAPALESAYLTVRKAFPIFGKESAPAVPKRIPARTHVHLEHTTKLLTKIEEIHGSLAALRCARFAESAGYGLNGGEEKTDAAARKSRAEPELEEKLKKLENMDRTRPETAEFARDAFVSCACFSKARIKTFFKTFPEYASDKFLFGGELTPEEIKNIGDLPCGMVAALLEPGAYFPKLGLDSPSYCLLGTLNMKRVEYSRRFAYSGAKEFLDIFRSSGVVPESLKHKTFSVSAGTSEARIGDFAAFRNSKKNAASDLYVEDLWRKAFFSEEEEAKDAVAGLNTAAYAYKNVYVEERLRKFVSGLSPEDLSKARRRRIELQGKPVDLRFFVAAVGIPATKEFFFPDEISEDDADFIKTISQSAEKIPYPEFFSDPEFWDYITDRTKDLRPKTGETTPKARMRMLNELARLPIAPHPIVLFSGPESLEKISRSEEHMRFALYGYEKKEFAPRLFDAGLLFVKRPGFSFLEELKTVSENDSPPEEYARKTRQEGYLREIRDAARSAANFFPERFWKAFAASDKEARRYLADIFFDKTVIEKGIRESAQLKGTGWSFDPSNDDHCSIQKDRTSAAASLLAALESGTLSETEKTILLESTVEILPAVERVSLNRREEYASIKKRIETEAAFLKLDEEESELTI